MKRMKKLMAVLLAVVMVLSLSVSAFATTTDNTSAITNGGAKGAVSNEGGMPADVLRFKAPTPDTGTFNLIVDPHDLIRQSQAAEKAKTAYNGGTFEEGAYAFFKKTEDGETSYGKESGALTVTNKSSTPITVDLTASIDRSKSGMEKITLVDSEAELTDLSKKAGLYLAVKSDDTEKAVSANAFGDITVDIDSALDSYIIGSKFEWVDGVSYKMKKALNDELGTSGKTMAVTVTDAVAAVAGDPTADPPVAAVAAADGKIGIADASWSANSGVSSDAGTKLVDTVTSNTRVLTLSVLDGSKPAAVAKVTFYFDMAAVVAASSAPTGKTVTLKAWDGNPYAQIITQTENREGAYSLQANQNGTGYDNVLDTSIEDDDFPKKSFCLKAAINRDDAWDNVAVGNGAGISGSIDDGIVLVWKIDTYVAPADPVLTVTTPGTKNGETATVSYTAGKGAVTAVNVLAVSYVSDGKTTTLEAGSESLSVDAAAKTFDLKVATKMLNEGVPATSKVVFLMSDGSTKEVPLDFTVEG